MAYDNDLIAAKLRRWEQYVENYRIPAWKSIPDIGLYMEQVVNLLNQYLDFFPPELKEDPLITPATINNYVRKKIIPEPQSKKYYRVHIAYLIMICALKYSLNISMIQNLIPLGISEGEVEERYTSFAARHRVACSLFLREAKNVAAHILNEKENEISSKNTEEIIITSAVIGTMTRLLAEKILLLDGKTVENGGPLEIEHVSAAEE